MPSSISQQSLLEESLEELYEQAPCGYLITHPNGTIVRVNQTFLDWTGYTRSELVQKKRFQNLLTVEGQIYYETHLAPLLRMQGSLSEIALDITDSEQRRLSTLINSVLKLDGQGKPAYVLTTVFDSRERRSYERELLIARNRAQEEARARSLLVSMISHDIRTPLSAVQMILPMLERTATPAQSEMLETLRTAVQSVLALTTEVLEFSRLDSGAVTLHEAPFVLKNFIDDVHRQLAHHIERSKVSFHIRLDDAIPARVIGDQNRIGQVLTNLLDNALKFTETGSVSLNVEVLTPPDGTDDSEVELMFEVTDTGIGMTDEEIDRVFGEFSQASPEIRGRFGGTGLGLSICRRILTLYNSEMEVESSPGVGTSFRFQLRLRIPSES